MRVSIKHQFLLLVFTLSLLEVKAQRVVFLMDDFDAERWYIDSAVFYNEAKSRGAEVFILHANADPELQVVQAKKAIDSLKADVMVLVSNDKIKSKDILNYADSRKVPLLLYDRYVDGVHSKYICFDNKEIGREQARFVLRNPEVKNIIMLNGPVSDNNAILFREGQKEIVDSTIAANRNIKVLLDTHMAGWTEFEALIQLNDFLTDNKVPIDAVIAANDAIAKGVIDALSFHGITNVLITGQDGTADAINKIREGSQSFTVVKPSAKMAKVAAIKAVELGKSKKNIKSAQKVVVNFECVDKNNVHRF